VKHVRSTLPGGSWVGPTSGDQHAALWYRHKVKDLGTLGGAGSYAYDINASGEVVGTAELSSGAYNYHAALFKNGKVIDLNSALSPTLAATVTLTDAEGINDKCEIVVNGFNNKTIDSVSFVLSPKHPSSCHRCERSDDWKAQSEHGADDSDCNRDDDGQDDGD
jgi:probable HAF family extracellular repeat protein